MTIEATGDLRAMTENQDTPQATPVNPPPHDASEAAPSATGTVAGDESELTEAPPSEDDGER